MPTQYFADTWFWVARINKRDNDHARAKKIEETIRNSIIVTSEMVLAELLNFFADEGRFWRALCSKFVTHIISNKCIEVVPQSTELFSASLNLYKDRPDQEWSFTDCSSFDHGRRVNHSRSHKRSPLYSTRIYPVRTQLIQFL
jgi:predicted nucleic acid-binding protein